MRSLASYSSYFAGKVESITTEKETFAHSTYSEIDYALDFLIFLMQLRVFVQVLELYWNFLKLVFTYHRFC